MDIEKTKFSKFYRWKPVRFVQLFVFIVVVMLLSPILKRTPLLMVILAAFFLNILIVTLSSAGYSPRRLWLLLPVWLIGTLLDSSELLVKDPAASHLMTVASELVKTLLLTICVVMILRYVLKSKEVTLDTVFGALVAYLLIAFAFASLYRAVAAIEPASFSMPARVEGVHGLSAGFDFSYFSFVTIATLGYGDIVPRLPATQILAILEAVIGQFFMAVVVAWLVSVLVAGRKKGS
ncbi:MAG TPA: ion channel [Geobacteraceae bacterium]|nr:ion channel [Geobacteraceae bacterium]